MRHLISILLSVIPIVLFGQLNIDTSIIKSEPITDTTNDAFYGVSKGLKPLVLSHNYLEIRMSVFYAPVGGFEDRIISYDGKTWRAKLRKSPMNLYDSKATTVSDLKPRHSFIQIINYLEDIGLFRLPSQSDLNKPIRIYDGNIYSITYKVGNRYRQLNFDNPTLYRKIYPEIAEFTKFEELINVFYTELEEH